MTPRSRLDETPSLRSFSPDFSAAQMETLLLEARRMRDAELARHVLSLARGVGRVLSVVGTTLASWPRRRATYESLRSLSDRELADIGIARGDIARVFEPDFVMPARAANDQDSATRAA
jgi:uncharacterized protein YjiS (DUF1127 family)